MEERMMRWFHTDDVTPKAQVVAQMYAGVAVDITDELASGPERTVALRKLLESRDAALRAARHPGK